MVALAIRTRPDAADAPSDPGRRRFLTLAGLGGFAWIFVGGALGRAARSVSMPDPVPIQDAMASDLGSEYMELIRRAYHPGRSGELQLVLAPYNSANYAPESRDLVEVLPRDQSRLRVDVPGARAAGRPRPRTRPAP